MKAVKNLFYFNRYFAESRSRYLKQIIGKQKITQAIMQIEKEKAKKILFQNLA